jgi:small subunit ribosomal protein S17
MTEKRNRKKQLKGKIVGNKMDKTVRVRVDTPVRHPVYKKVVNKRKVFFAHTDKKLEIGEEVTIEESRPYSKNVKWIVKETNVTKGK